MKIALRILLVLIVVVGVMHFMAPKEFLIERDIVINKPKDYVFSQMKQLKTHEAWNPWAEKDPNVKYTYKGVDGTVGFIVAWEGNNEVGSGEEEIKNITEGERVDIELRFKKPMEDVGMSHIVTETVSENQTRVRWSMQGQFKFPGTVICMVLNMQKKLGSDFENGLQKLKTILEK